MSSSKARVIPWLRQSFDIGCCRYLPVAQNGLVNLPTQLKIDEGYYGKGFYFTRFPRLDGVCARCMLR